MKWLQKLFGRMGWELRPKPRRPFPYVIHQECDDYRFDFWISNRQSQQWFDVPHVELAAEIRELVRMTAPGDTVLEVGSHHGYFAMVLAYRIGETGRLVGVEPFPENAMTFQAQVHLNGFGARCRALNLGLSDREGELWITPDENRCFDEEVAGAVRVRVMRGDDLEGVGRPVHLLKVDVEGHERRVLRGCADILSAHPKLAIELHPHLMDDPARELDEVFELIHIGRYAGTMTVRQPGIDQDIVPFDREAIPLDCITNVFLEGNGSR
ncbi:MAG TPA: FkbM family methyltransferase [Planctomycetota bacterium]|nr:FkbM family methyltransferase [Planctomycetota bacterium]